MEGCSDLPRLPGFVPSDYPQVYHSLTSIASARTAVGEVFCEWGSGFGVVACLAAMNGFRAVGIEIEPVLVDAARCLAADFGLDVEFICDSYLPREACEYLDTVQPSLYLVEQPGDLGANCGLDPDSFDVIFAYPGPDDDPVIADLFRRFASSGALLLTYHGREGLRLRRKIHRRRRCPRRLAKWKA